MSGIRCTFYLQIFTDVGRRFYGGGDPGCTVDNGSSSGANQSYLNTQIIGYDFNDGSDSLSVNTTDHIVRTVGSQTYITTDASGIPTLDISALVSSAQGIRISTLPSGAFVDAIQLATNLGPGMAGFTGMTVIIGDVIGGTGKSGTIFHQATPIVGSVVPLPAAAWLFASCLAGLVGVRFKRR